MPDDSPISVAFVSSVSARLASRRAEKSPAPADAAVALGGLQEAASVLVSFQVDTLKPVPGAPFEDTREKLIAASVPQVGGGSSRQWILLPEVRIAALRQLRGTSRVQVALDANPERPRHPVQDSLESYLTGTATPVEAQTLVEITASQQVSAWLRPAGFNNVPDLAAIQRRAEWLKLLQPFEHLAGEFFRGRRTELARLRSYVGVVPPGSLESARRSVATFFSGKSPLLIYGPGGVGKSTLIARFILEHARALESDRFPFVYLDFDRPEITAAEPLTLLIEAVRQLGIEYPEAQERFERIRTDWLQRFRSEVAPTSTPAAESSSSSLSQKPPAYISPNELSGASRDFASLISSVGAAGQPVVIVLDTFEEVQWRSEEQVAAVWNLFDELRPALERLCVIIVGRAPVTGRKTEEMELKGLDSESAVGYLQARGVSDPKLAGQIANSIGGSPMNLKLAADLVVREGIRSGSELGVSTREFLFFRLDDAHVQRQLHKRILEHIHNERVRQIASPGLVLRRITPELIFEVLNQACALNLTTLEQAKPLFEELRREVSLVHQDSDGSLVNRPELRIQILTLLHRDEPQKVAEIHQAAVNYYERRSIKPSQRAEEIYHRLALGQERTLIESRWLPGVESYLQDAFDEFSGSTRAYLATRLGKEVDDHTRNLASLEDYEDIVRRKATDLLAQGEAQQALELLGGRPDRSSESPLYALEATALSQLGRLPEAFATLDHGITQALPNGVRRQVLDLVLQATDLALVSRQYHLAPWLVSRIQCLCDARLQPEDRLAIIARIILLAVDVPFPMDPGSDLEADLRKVFDELSDQDLARRPDVARWAAATFKAQDISRLSRVLKNTGVPRVGTDLELRELATRVTFFDAAFSQDRGEAAGALAKEAGVPVGVGLTASWSDFLLTAPLGTVQETLCRLLDEHATLIPQEVMQAFASLMRAAVRPTTSQESPRHEERRSSAPSKLEQPLQAKLLAALLRTFPDPAKLKQFLQLRLNWSLDSIAADGPLMQRAFSVIQWAAARGSLVDLVESARQASPSDADLAEVAAELGIATLVPRKPPLTMLKSGLRVDLTEWRERLGVIEGQVGRVEVGTQTTGTKTLATGFLVGADLMLTADHVLHQVHNGSVPPSDVLFRLDYKTAGDRVISQGNVFVLAQDWLVARDEYKDTAPSLGYSLVRLVNSPGSQPIGGARAASSDALRGWIRLETFQTLSPGDEFVVVHHPMGESLILSVGTVSKIGSDDPMQVSYSLFTEPGSSGAPCFTIDFRLAAFHIGTSLAGKPLSSGVSYGTRISAVVDDLRHRNLENLISTHLL